MNCSVISPFRQLGLRELNNDRIKATNLSIEEILTVLADDELFGMRRLEKEVIEKREIEMLTNIYSYSKEHPYDHALFFIGSGHRESIIKKMSEFHTTQEIKLNWVIRDNDNYIPLPQIPRSQRAKCIKALKKQADSQH